MMLSTSLRPLLRPAVANLCLKPARRLVGTTTFHRSHSWQGSVMRLGLAIGVVYHFSTSSVFAESPSPDYAPSDHDRSAVDELVTNRDEALAGTVISTSKQVEASKSQANAESAITTDDRTVSDEKDASQQGAFNPDTGEFNWDCSCLGGMAHGPCGEEFKAAFSCFMLSTEEPRGMECIEKFQTMQTCFRKYPEVYGAELADEDSHSPSFDDEHAHINSQTTHSETDKTTSKLSPEP